MLHIICETAVSDGLLAANPCQITDAMNTSAKRKPIIPTIPQLAALADAVPERFKALVLLKAWCGMRWGEVTELRRGDIDNDCEVGTSVAASHTETASATSTPPGRKRRTRWCSRRTSAPT